MNLLDVVFRIKYVFISYEAETVETLFNVSTILQSSC